MTPRERAEDVYALMDDCRYTAAERIAEIERHITEHAAEVAISDIHGTASIVGQLREIVTDQANDPGLWYDADRAPEAYLQHALRDLHGVVERAIEGLSPAQPATAAQEEKCDLCGIRRDLHDKGGCTRFEAAPPSPAAREIDIDKGYLKVSEFKAALWRAYAVVKRAFVVDVDGRHECTVDPGSQVRIKAALRKFIDEETGSADAVISSTHKEDK